MKLESQVCNLDLSKRLKELGVKQEGYFAWTPQLMMGSDKQEYGLEENPGGVFCISAFTVAELGEMLPPTVMIDYAQCVLNIGPSGPSNEFWCVSFIGIQHCHRRLDFAADSEANARAKMLIYLIENKLVKASIQMTAGRMEE